MEKTTKKIIIADKSKAFALRIIKLFTYLKKINKNTFYHAKYSEAEQVLAPT